MLSLKAWRNCTLTLAETVAACQLVEGGYIPRMPTEMEKLEALVSFVNQLMELHPIISSKGMNSSSTQFVTPSRFGIYEPIHQLGTWGENFKSNGNPNTSTPIIMEVDTKLDTQIQRRLAQNCEAARKSRLRKKV
ncbi:transcription factor TGA1-like [Mangifera indica]|uniref:transcription factor TGA1-like n=1 Tax=Mangifera indica TaxID=29780 RepID=UPI001CF97B6D|nr:transcription factor TGA1-like [Mangifera indica]